jgi:hypothetical protein
MPLTTAQQLDQVQTAISQIELYGQSYTFKERTMTRADLQTLYKREERLKTLYVRENRGGTGGPTVTYGVPCR